MSKFSYILLGLSILFLVILIIYITFYAYKDSTSIPPNLSQKYYTSINH